MNTKLLKKKNNKKREKVVQEFTKIKSLFLHTTQGQYLVFVCFKSAVIFSLSVYAYDLLWVKGY